MITNSEEVIFDKDKHRQRIAEIKRAKCRREHVKTELDGAERKVSGLRIKLTEAEDMLAEKHAALDAELSELNDFLKGIE